MVAMMLVGGCLVVAGAGVAILACWVGYRLAVSYEHQAVLERERYGTAGPPGA